MNMTCINCPMGCFLTVEQVGGEIVVKGNTCARGVTYGKQEFTLPMRMVTSLVKVRGRSVVPVKTDAPIPKDKIFDVLQVLKTVEVDAPIHIGDVILRDVLGLNVNVVATKNII